MPFFAKRQTLPFPKLARSPSEAFYPFSKAKIYRRKRFFPFHKHTTKLKKPFRLLSNFKLISSIFFSSAIFPNLKLGPRSLFAFFPNLHGASYYFPRPTRNFFTRFPNLKLIPNNHLTLLPKLIYRFSQV